MPDNPVLDPVAPIESTDPIPVPIDKEKALHSFWSGFNWKAYDENTTPDYAIDLNSGHYITYTVATAALDERVTLSANLWCRDTSWATITEKANAISTEIGIGGKLIPFDDGYLWICRGTPFAQRLDSGDSTIRRIYLNLMAEFLSAD